MILDLFVPGIPAPQGSKSFKGMRGGKAILAESSKSVKPWRESIRWAIHEGWRGEQMQGAVCVLLEFVMPRPAYVRNKPSPPAIKRPDIDKLVRSCLDAIGSAGVYRDDSQVTDLAARKRIAKPDERCGVRIHVSAADEALRAIGAVS